MTGGGKKLAFGMISLVSLSASLFELMQNLLIFCDVTNHTWYQQTMPSLKRAQTDVHWKFRTITPAGIKIQPLTHGTNKRAGSIFASMFGMDWTQLFWQQNFNRLTQQFIVGVAKHIFGTGVHRDNLTAFISDHERIWHDIKQRPDLFIGQLIHIARTWKIFILSELRDLLLNYMDNSVFKPRQ